MDDFWDEPHAKLWARDVLDGMAPKLADSAATISLIPGESGKFDEGDAKFWVELGASIMMNKPIIAVVYPGQPIPDKLRRVVDEIVVLKDGINEEASRELGLAIDRVIGEG